MRLWKIAVVAAGLFVVGVAGYLGIAIYIDNVEHPQYRTVLSDGAIEVRDYGPMTVAEITSHGARRKAVSQAFRPLANYIFAKERIGDAIAMTAPVTQARRAPVAMTAPVTQQMAQSQVDTHDNGGGVWTVRFVMPSKYALDTLPKPQNQDIGLIEIKSRKRAVIRFSGVATDTQIAEHEAKLRAWIETRGLKIMGSATYAYYNSPFTPGFMRRNEVMFDLQDER